MYLLHGSFYNDSDAGWEVGKCLIQKTAVCDAILLEAVEERCWCVLHLRLFDNHNTLKVGVHSGGLCVGSNSNVGEVARSFMGIINLTKALVKEVIEAFMDVICLCHDYCVAFDG